MQNKSSSIIELLQPNEISSVLKSLLETSASKETKHLHQKGYIPLSEEQQEMYYKILPYIFDTSNEVRNWLKNNHFCILRMELHNPNLALYIRERI